MRRVNVIHLSDIHFDNSNKSNEILEELKEDLLKMKEELGGFHLLLITGDCVDKGQVELFKEFCNKLNIIVKSCGLTKKKVLIMLGNHDSSKKNPWLTSFFSSIDNEKMSKEEVLNSIEPTISPLYPDYNENVKKYVNTPDGIGVNEFQFKFDNQTSTKIRVISVNTSWSTAIYNKYGDLIIGDTQIEKLKKSIEELNNKQKIYKQKKCDYTILCMHHPLDWFKYNERKKIEQFIKSSEVDFVLHGHIHTAGFENVNNIDNTSNIFCTGISYQKTGETCSRKDGMRYSIYEINKDTQTVNVYIRSTNDQGKFVEDNRLYKKSKNGFFTMSLENPNNCVLPFKTVDNVSKMYTVLNQETVRKILSKERLLFDLYCNMEQVIQNQYLPLCESETFAKEIEKYEESWKKKNTIGCDEFVTKGKETCKKDFYREQFELFCYDLLINLHSVFFKSSKTVRFLIRKYDTEQKVHKAFVSEGYNDKLDNIKNFPWETSLVYHSFKKESALLQSCNYKYYDKGNSDIWINSLTITINNICVQTKSEMIPLLSFNIAISEQKSEACLEALALSSIYEKIRAIFNLFDNQVINIASLYE
ncbi:metallophosphoesterase family protein [Lacrimispora amygdalina]|uniref:metallophosphoesterase family protein n=1 Tax=Lacrimispora amygdalina TaxID=253257 RepID=UPI00140BF571|nr:metallophosphoesterase [Lacrimispora amygdalina]